MGWDSDDDDDIDDFSDTSSSPFGGGGGSPFGGGNDSPFGGGGGSPFGGGGNSSPFGGGGNGSPFGGGGNGSPFGGGGNGSPFGGGGNGSPFGGGGNGSPFGGGNSSPFGGGNSSPFGGGNSSPFGMQRGNVGFGPQANMQMQSQQQVSSMDQLGASILKASSEAMLVTITSIIDSIKLRNIDDWATIGHSWLITGGITCIFGLIFTIFGVISRIETFLLGGLSGRILVAGLLTVSAGLLGFGLSMYLKSVSDKYFQGQTEEVSQDSLLNALSEDTDLPLTPDEEFGDSDFYEGDVEEELAKITAAMCGENEEDENAASQFEEPPEVEVVEEEPKRDYNASLENIQANVPFLSKKYLFTQMKSLFPLRTPDFYKREELNLDSREVTDIEDKLNDTFDLLSKNQEVKAKIKSVYKTIFSYEIRIERPKGIKPEEISNELKSFFKEDKDDNSTSIDTVKMEKDYIISISRGDFPGVFVGDCFNTPEVEAYMTNEKNVLPVIGGISDTGKVRMVDFKDNLSVLISGRQRSGKSWYVFSTLLTLTAFNTPEDLQLIVVDPKTSPLFKSFSTLPHVCGFHGDDALNNVLTDMMAEMDRRKQILLEENVDTIWDLRKKGIKMPVLYLVIDEFIQAITKADELGVKKSVLDNLNVLLTKAPAYGMGYIIICHRSSQYIPKLMRMNTAFKVVARADVEAVLEELAIDKKEWSHPLLNPGDLAVKGVGFSNAVFLKGTGVTASDAENGELAKVIAKAWYKMGVTLPDMSVLPTAANRDENEVIKMLSLDENSNRVQYDFKPSNVTQSDNNAEISADVAFDAESLIEEDEDADIEFDDLSNDKTENEDEEFADSQEDIFNSLDDDDGDDDSAF